MRLEKLIDAVKKYELLYDPGNPDYKDIPMRRQIWRVIAKEVNMSDHECQTKWKNLRDTFVRKINQQKIQKMSGKEYERTPWRYYKLLTFLMPYVHPRMPTPYLPTQVEYPDDDEDEDSSVTPKTNSLRSVDGLFDVMIDRVSSDDDRPVRAPILLQLKKEADTSSEATPAKQQKCDPPAEPASATLTASWTPETTAEVKDDVYYFSNFIAERLRSFSPRRRDAKMRSIFTALFSDE